MDGSELPILSTPINCPTTVPFVIVIFPITGGIWSTVIKNELVKLAFPPALSTTPIVMFLVPFDNPNVDDPIATVHWAACTACPVGEQVRLSLLALYCLTKVSTSGASTLYILKFNDVFPLPVIFTPVPL